MSTPKHSRKDSATAERILDAVDRDDTREDMVAAASVAQVHATLALVAAVDQMREQFERMHREAQS